MKACSQVKLREVDSATEFIQKVFKQWNGVFVLDSLLVESSVIYAETPSSIFNSS